MASEPKWTSGPWHLFNKNRTVAVTGAASEAPHNEVVHWTGFDASHYQQQVVANARLIAAAPDLYEALAEAVLQIEYLHDKFDRTGTGEAVLTRAAAALAKARGE